MKRVLLTFALILFLAAPLAPADTPAPAAPADTLSLSVDEAVAMAIQRNRDVQKARQQVDALHGKIHEVRSQAFPDVKIQGGMMRFRDPSFLNSSSFDKIPIEFKDALTADAANIFNYGVQAKQPLYTAGKVGTAIKIANLEREGVNSDLDRVEQQVALDVVRTFYAVLLAEKQADVARETLEQRKKHLEVVKSRFAAGDSTEVDVLRSQVNVANAEPDVIRAENAIRQARSTLNNLLVRDPGAPLDVRGTFVYEPWPENGLDSLAGEALRRRPEMSRLRIQDREAEEQLNLANAESKLRVDLTTYFGVSSRLMSNLGNQDFERWSFSFDFSLPVFDGGRRSGLVTQAVAGKHITKLSLEGQENAIRLEVQQALDEIRRAEKTVEATQLNVTQAERVLGMMQNNFKYGAATTLDVVDAQTALSLARTNLFQSLYDDAIGKARLRWVLGRPVLPSPSSHP